MSPFDTENTGYEKTILSDLQGAWSLLRSSVVENPGFEGWQRALFQIDEAMSWEVVRDLRQMRPLLVVIRNICTQGDAPSEILDTLNDIQELLDETLEEFTK